MSSSADPQDPSTWVSDDGKTASLADQKLESVPDSLENQTALTTLDLQGNYLTELPDWLGKLTNLTTLRLASNRLTCLPESLGDLTSLTSLNLLNNRLTAVPESLGKLTNLTTLDLANNRLTVLPESLGKLTSLTTLHLENNRLTCLPESLGKLTKLTMLYLASNRLTAVPESLEKLKARGRLSLRDNPLTATPESQEVERLPATTQRTKHSQPSTSSPVTATISSEQGAAWPGQSQDHAWNRLRSLFAPSVSIAALSAAAKTNDPAAAILELYTWERDRLLTLAKGTGGAAVTVLAGLIAAAIEGKIAANAFVLFLAAGLVVALLLWGGFLLAGLRPLAEEYPRALRMTRSG